MVTLRIPIGNGTLCCEVQVLGAPRAEDDQLPVTYPDEYLNHWAEVWRRNRHLWPHVSLLAFLVDPVSIQLHYLDPARDCPGESPRRLLPRQQRVADEISAADERTERQRRTEELEEALAPPNCQLRGRRYIEPLHHHAHAHGRRAYFRKKEGAGNG